MSQLHSKRTSNHNARDIITRILGAICCGKWAPGNVQFKLIAEYQNIVLQLFLVFDNSYLIP